MAVSDLSASTPQSAESPSARPAGTRVVIPDQVEPSISIGVAMAVLAVAYYVSGKLGLLLALPPGYATAVFPPSGIALAGFLIYGTRVWPAVWLGSFAMNMGAFLGSGGPDADPGSLVVAAGIASGAALQAFVGALLVRRYARPDKFQLADRSVGRLLLLGGPVGCLVSASIGSTCLLLSGALSREQILYSWGTWWVGDTIGVLVFTPLTLSWIAWRTTLPLRRRLAVTIPMVLSFGLVVLLYVYTSTREEAQLRDDFEAKTDILYQTLVSRLEDQLVSLDAIERFITGSDNLTRKNFAHVVAPFLRRYTGVQGYSWDPTVSAEQRAAVETAARAEGFPKFEIREIGPDGQLARAGRRSWYVPVRYIEPLERNARVLGFDVMSDVDRRSTLEAARDSGRTLATTPFPLLQRDKRVPGIVIYRPVYLRGVEPDTLEAKRRNIQGFVAGVFRVKTFIESALDARVGAGIGLRARDALHSSSSVAPLYDNTEPSSTSGAGPSDRKFVLTKSYRLEVAGRPWELDFVADQTYISQARTLQSWAVLGAGMLFTGLLGAFLMTLTLRSVRAEETNKRMRRAIGKLGTAETEAVANERRFRVLLDAAPESIIGFDRLGVCTFCNPASVAIFAAASAADLVGKSIRELLARIVDQEVAAHIAHAVDRGVAVDLPVVELARGGARPPIFACWVRPKLHGTNYVGCVVGFMDITERIRQHQELDHERRRLTAVLDSIEVGVIACDANGEMVIYNRAMTRINGLADDATTAEKIAARANWRYPGADGPPPESELPLLRTLAGKSVRDQEVSLHIPGKAPRLLVVTGKHLSDAEGHTVGAVIAVHDITARQRAIESQHEANVRLEAGLERLRRVNDWAVVLGELTSALQSCSGIDEAHALVTKFMRRLFPERTGALFVPEPEGDRFSCFAQWGTRRLTEVSSFTLQDCWALRRGHVHWVGSPTLDPVCPHTDQRLGESMPYVCIPLSSPNELLGVIQLEVAPGDAALQTDEQQFADTLCTQVSVALANIKLRDTLRQQSIRDPLTGLFNRRYLEDALGRELARAERAESPVSVAMLDLDHFKSFNDECGHDAGDAVLSAVAEKLISETRRSDIACRLGGEEFVVLMPGASVAAARRRAESLRAAISRVVVIHGGQPLRTVTASVGVATFPGHGRGSAELLRSADAALYEAKRMGRNRVVAIAKVSRLKVQKTALP